MRRDEAMLMEKAAAGEVTLETATILAVPEADGGLGYTLALAERRVSARRAAGCLLAPAQGDRVLVSLCGAGETYILTVLERQSAEAPARIGVAAAPAVRLAAPNLELEAAERLRVSSDELEVESRRARVTGRLWAVAVDAATAVARKLETHFQLRRASAEQLVEDYDMAVRRVQGVDSQTAGSLLLKADETLLAEAQNVVVGARKHVRIDGEQIAMG